VLLVDDDPSTLSSFRTILALEGYKVEVALGGERAIEMMNSQIHSPDLILSDLRMPDRSGLEVLAEARVITPDATFILYSAFATQAITAAARRLGAVDVVDGMIDSETLIKVVRNALQLTSESGSGPICNKSFGPAAERWAKAVSTVVHCRSDVPTVDDWARLGNSSATLKKICRECGTSAGVSLDLARAFRIVRKYQRRRCDWYNELDIKA
jgi:CheY-like chemotaxis protein